MIVISELVNQVSELILNVTSVFTTGEISDSKAVGAGPARTVSDICGNRYDFASFSLLVARAMSLSA